MSFRATWLFAKKIQDTFHALYWILYCWQDEVSISVSRVKWVQQQQGVNPILEEDSTTSGTLLKPYKRQYYVWQKLSIVQHKPTAQGIIGLLIITHVRSVLWRSWWIRTQCYVIAVMDSIFPSSLVVLDITVLVFGRNGSCVTYMQSFLFFLAVLQVDVNTPSLLTVNYKLRNDTNSGTLYQRTCSVWFVVDVLTRVPTESNWMRGSDYLCCIV